MTDEDVSIEGGAAAVEGAPTAPLGATRRLGGATAGMAVGTTLSRLTGLIRVVAMAAALSGGGFADAYNLANTTPNIITDIVIGGVLAATFVPVFVAELTTHAAKEAWDAISAVVTVTIAILVVATVAFFILTPSIIDLYTSTNHHADVHSQQQVAVFLLRWFVPQLACYGLIALFTALLNTQGKFAAPMFVPIANNLVVIAVLVVPAAVDRRPVTIPLASTFQNLFHSEGKAESAQDRLNLAAQAETLIPQHLLIGWGLGVEFPYYETGSRTIVTTAYAHNIVLDLWLRVGLIGLALFLIALFASAAGGLRTWRRHPDPMTAALSLAVVAVSAGLIATAFLEPFLDEYRLATLFGVFLGMGRAGVTSMARLPRPGIERPGADSLKIVTGGAGWT